MSIFYMNLPKSTKSNAVSFALLTRNCVSVLFLCGIVVSVDVLCGSTSFDDFFGIIDGDDLCDQLQW